MKPTPHHTFCKKQGMLEGTTRLSKKALMLMVVMLCFVGALVSEGCTPKEKSFENADGTSATSGATWSAAADCSSCHVEASKGTDAGISDYHMGNQGFECSTCHTDVDALQEAHGNMAGEVPSRLKKTQLDCSFCESCHESAELIESTADSTILTDIEGTVVNPHSLPDNDDHALISCIDCHAGHQNTSVEEKSAEHCVSCHHEGVYECGTCHT